MFLNVDFFSKVLTGHYESADIKHSQLGILMDAHVPAFKSSRPAWATKDQYLKRERAGDMPQK